MVSVMVCVVMTVWLYGLFPREWMDVLSPPIMPPSQQRRSAYTQNNLERLVRGMVTFITVLLPPDRLLCPWEYVRQQTDPCFNTSYTKANGNSR